MSPRTLSCREAMREALAEAMRGDERVVLMGEDVARYGGCYAVSKGLAELFGEERVRDTPLSESGYTGLGVGAAIGGMRPIVELMTVNFSLLALDQIINNAATFRHMSNGQVGVPLVIRMACGAGKQLGAQHSHSLEGLYAHVPGLKVLAPGTVEDFRGMLAPALADPDPVIIFEHTGLYGLSGELPVEGPEVDIRRAKIRRAGSDVSLVTYGGSLPKAMQAAEMLDQDGISAEVLDLRVLRPLDEGALLDSVKRTRRAVLVDENWLSGGMMAEVAARLAHGAFWWLDAPIERVCKAEVPIPYAAHLEQAALPQVEAIVNAAKRACNRG